MKKFITYTLLSIHLCSLPNFFTNENNISVKTTKNYAYSEKSTKELNWYFGIRNDGNPPHSPKESKDFISSYDSYYLGDTSKKVLYLTFDEGYENGYTEKILDILKKHDAKAAFFVVKPYIKQNPHIVKRMVEEGHLVCNHSSTHPSMASVVNKDKFNKEFTDVEDEYKNLIGEDMPKFFRPPMGKYSERSLMYTKDLGYKTIFWSFAYNDWDVNKQPENNKAKETILKRSHNGAIVLLHAVSKTNTEILDEVLESWKSTGYEIKPLTDLPETPIFINE